VPIAIAKVESSHAQQQQQQVQVQRTRIFFNFFALLCSVGKPAITSLSFAAAMPHN